jgi:SPP1 family phage portal protein
MIQKDNLLQLITANQYRRDRQVESELYYRGENTFIAAVKKQIALQIGESVVPVENPYTANFKETSGYYKLLVDQAVSYSINDKMQCAVGGVDVETIMGNKWRSVLRTVAKDARLKGFGVVHFYLENGKTKFKKIPAEQCIPCYEDDILTAMVRIYKINRSGKEFSILEYWTAETKTVYERSDGTEWVCVVDAVPHIVTTTAYGSSIQSQESSGWGVVPFAVLRNNDEYLPDLNAIKSKIDAYDVVSSDYINDLINHGSPYFVLKNYSSTNQEEFNKFKANFVKSKVYFTDEDGGVDIKALDIPYEARVKKLENLEREIFLFGMGVNVSAMKGNITATEIMAGYDNLNLKAQEFEGCIIDFIDDVVQFIKYGTGITQELLQIGASECTFVHPMVFDENKKIELILQSKGHLSQETLLNLDPRVPNAEEEQKRLEGDMDNLIEKYSQQPVVGVDDGETN